MLEEKVTIQNEVGLHARAASLFVKEASKFQSKISLIKDGTSYNGKSIMSVISMQAYKGEDILIRAEGDDEKVALESLVELIHNEIAGY